MRAADSIESSSSNIRNRFRINNRIRAREVRLIGEDGGQIGIVSFREAMQRAEDAGVDLVEVDPNGSPPVCRLMDYGKFRYEQSKRERDARKHQKQTELKELRLKPKTDDHDLDVKARRARSFLESGHKVKFSLRFRGRELAHTNIGRDMLDGIIDKLRDIAVVEQRPQLESRVLSLVLAPNSKVAKAAQQAQRQRIKEEKEEKAAQHQAKHQRHAQPLQLPIHDHDVEEEADFDDEEDGFDEGLDDEELDDDDMDDDDEDMINRRDHKRSRKE